MNEMMKTIAFLIVAAVIAIATIILNAASKPQVADYAKLVGTEFFPEFNDPNIATSLKVTQYDATKDETKQFEVLNNNGNWSIPTHHNYPADGDERLSKTAASVIGIKREGLAGRREAEYEKFGVIDPLNATEAQTKGRGDRITISKKDGTLCDYIIGKQVEGKEGLRYVRKPDETRIYIAQINPDLTTKFIDWIEPNLLKIDRNLLNSIFVYRYQIDEQQGTSNILDQLSLTRDKPEDEWKLQDLNPEKEELVQTEINSIINQLDQLKIVGVRPKPAGLGASLKNDKGMAIDQLSRLDLQSKGFYLVKNEEGGITMYSNEGELWAGTSQGVNYTLRFGEVFEGDAEDIEIGKTQGDNVKEENKTKDDASKDENKPAIKPGDELKKSRYVFVTAEYDASLLGNPPAKPEKPAILDEPIKTITPAKEEPKKETPKAETAPVSDAKPNTTSDKQPEKNETEKSAPPKDADKPQSMQQKLIDGQETFPVSLITQDEKPADKPTTDVVKPEEPKTNESKPEETKPVETKLDTVTPPEDPAITRKKAEDAYNAAMEQYKRDLDAYNKKKEDGKKLVKQLNARFADWYYVISADSFESFSKSREKLVKPKAADKPAADNTTPDNKTTIQPETAPATPDSKEQSVSPPSAAPNVEMKKEEPKPDAPAQTPAESKTETPTKESLPEIKPETNSAK
jgi:hypothetical protein